MRKSFLKKLLIGCVFLFALMNVIAYFHAFKFTHFAEAGILKTKDARHLSFGQKLKAVFMGVDNPRPENKIVPSQAFETIQLKSHKQLEAWLIRGDSAKGTVVLCHGYSGHKSSMLDKADVFLKLGYNTLLLDFMGSGGSEGSQTTIGFYEAQEVKTAFDYLAEKGEKNIVLFGTSMGAVAIMKAISDYQLPVSGIIIECPFGTLLETVESRFKTMHVPAFPMARLLVYWGGIQNDFPAFEHNPVDYAGKISCPVLLLYGGQDEKVSRAETDRLFSNLKGIKTLKTYPLAGHENYLHKYKPEWTSDVTAFIASLKNK